MKSIKLGLIFSASMLFVIACSQSATVGTNAPANVTVTNATAAQAEITPAATDDLASAAKIYSEKCVGCHRENGAGGEKVFEDGTKIKAPNFASARMRKDDDNDWIEAIENGVKEDGMPAYKGKISDEEIKNLVKYIRREFQK